MRWWLCAGAILFGVVVAGYSAVMAATNGQGTPTDDAAVTLLPETEAYAAYAGVNREEAEQRLARQQSIGEAQVVLAQRYGHVFGGLYVEHHPRYRLVVLLTDAAALTPVQVVLGDFGLEAEIRFVPYTLDELEAARAWAVAQAQALGLSVESGINIPNNKAELYVSRQVVSLESIQNHLRELNPELFRRIQTIEQELSLPVSSNVQATVRGGKIMG